MKAWNGWYHVTGSTYGTWMPGDPRGWRTRKHRQHVEGDYRNPPPAGMHDELLRRSESLLKGRPVRLDRIQRRVAVEAIVDKLLELDIQVIAASVDGCHLHVLAKFRDDNVRVPVGVAKKNASHLLRGHGLPGTVWARRCRPLPIRDRRHQVNVFNYIVGHARRGACVWTFRDGIIEPRDCPIPPPRNRGESAHP